jgi:hypothetical protein
MAAFIERVLLVFRSLALVSVLLPALCASAQARILRADPSAKEGDGHYYRDLVAQLRAGDTLLLPAGIYSERLNLEGLQGRDDGWITINGPESGAPAIITTQSG